MATPLTFVFSQAHTLIAIDQVPASGSIEAGCGQALIVLLFTVEAMVAWREREAYSQMSPLRPTQDLSTSLAFDFPPNIMPKERCSACYTDSRKNDEASSII